MPRATRDAIVALADGQARAGVRGFASVETRLDDYRARVASFVGGTGADIAFLRNTGDGANTIARGLEWTAGDEIMLCENEFGANALPWLALREFGVRIVFVRAPHERLTPDVLARAITSRTRVVALSWVSFADGYRHELAPLSEIAHARGAVFCVDAIQGLGAFPIDVTREGIDALYAGGAKWLLGVPGVGVLYVSPALRERLTVRWRGWKDVADIWNFLDYDQPLAAGAARFEGGTQNFIGIAALGASIDVLSRAGIANVGRHVLALTDRLASGLLARGAELATERGPGISSGIVTFAFSGRDALQIGRELGRAGFVTTYRPAGIRVSPHGYNTEDEIDALLAALDVARTRD